MSAFVEKLKENRIRIGYTQKDLATRLGMSITTYASYEQGRSEPSMDVLIKIANTFGCSVDYIIGRESEDSMIVIEGDKIAPEIGPADAIYNQLNDKNKFRFLSYGQGLLDGEKG